MINVHVHLRACMYYSPAPARKGKLVNSVGFQPRAVRPPLAKSTLRPTVPIMLAVVIVVPVSFFGFIGDLLGEI